MEQISKALNTKTEIFVGSDYNATIEAMRASKVDVALMGAFGYVLATTQAPIEAFAVTVTGRQFAGLPFDHHRPQGRRRSHLADLAQGPHLRFRPELDLGLIDAESGNDGQSHRSGARSEETQYSGGHDAASSPLRRARSTPHPSPTAFMRTLAQEGRRLQHDQGHLDVAGHSQRPAVLPQGHLR